MDEEARDGRLNEFLKREYKKRTGKDLPKEFSEEEEKEIMEKVFPHSAAFSGVIDAIQYWKATRECEGYKVAFVAAFQTYKGRVSELTFKLEDVVEKVYGEPLICKGQVERLKEKIKIKGGKK